MKRTTKDLLHPKKKQPKLSKPIVDQVKFLRYLEDEVFSLAADLDKQVESIADKAASLVEDISGRKGHPITIYDPNDPICIELSPLGNQCTTMLLDIINRRIHDRTIRKLMNFGNPPSDALITPVRRKQ